MLNYEQIKNRKMIAYLKGTIAHKTEKSLIVSVQGVGYEVFVLNQVIAEAKNGQEIELWIHTLVREDELSLYGFLKQERLAFFKQLISVSGIGPKMAMDILSSPIEMVQSAILNNDITVLTKIKGLGKKTAERLVLELKNKITPVSLKVTHTTLHNQEVIEALVGLGYERFHVVQALTDVPKELAETEAIIKYFLKNQV